MPIVPQGGNTGLVGGGVPPEDGHNIVLALDRMSRIRAIDPVNFYNDRRGGLHPCRPAAGRHRGRPAVPLSLGAEGSCQIGGNLSTNAGGIAVLRYGNTRELTLGLEVVLPDGQIWDGLRQRQQAPARRPQQSPPNRPGSCRWPCRHRSLTPSPAIPLQIPLQFRCPFPCNSAARPSSGIEP